MVYNFFLIFISLFTVFYFLIKASRFTQEYNKKNEMELNANKEEKSTNNILELSESNSEMKKHPNRDYG